MRLRRGMRLTGRAPFDRLFREGRKSADAHMVVLARANGMRRARLGLAVGRKHFRASVARNRVKRVMRESFRLHQQQLRGMDVLIIARRGMASLDAPGLRAALARHWRNIAPPPP